jgi:hypothetical protein
MLSRITALELDLAAQRRAHDDLDDQFRRFRGRMSKRAALDEAEAREAAPADGAAARAPARNGRPPSVAELRANGRWPLR